MSTYGEERPKLSFKFQVMTLTAHTHIHCCKYLVYFECMLLFSVIIYEHRHLHGIVFETKMNERHEISIDFILFLLLPLFFIIAAVILFCFYNIFSFFFFLINSNLMTSKRCANVKYQNQTTRLTCHGS